MGKYRISPEKFVEQLRSGAISARQVVDVREAFERDYYHLEGTLFIPMNTIPERLGELPQDGTCYVICTHGIRSAAVCRYLIELGYDNVANVDGGMAAVAELRGFDYD